jgi:4-amino-4-deoxy-L-arabinose transferase-like glycosyltransferase
VCLLAASTGAGVRIGEVYVTQVHSTIAFRLLVLASGLVAALGPLTTLVPHPWNGYIAGALTAAGFLVKAVGVFVLPPSSAPPPTIAPDVK